MVGNPDWDQGFGSGSVTAPVPGAPSSLSSWSEEEERSTYPYRSFRVSRDHGLGVLDTEHPHLGPNGHEPWGQHFCPLLGWHFCPLSPLVLWFGVKEGHWLGDRAGWFWYLKENPAVSFLWRGQAEPRP